MINLIPTHARKMVKTEYWIRTISVWMILIGLAGVGVIVLHVPVWVLINNQAMALENSHPDAKAQAADIATAEAEVTAANELANLLNKPLPDRSLVDIFSLVNSYTDARVTISQFSVSRAISGRVEEFTISGQAARREDLANFQTRLESEKRFGAVTLPISNLARGTDLPFTITITVEPVETL